MLRASARSSASSRRPTSTPRCARCSASRRSRRAPQAPCREPSVRAVRRRVTDRAGRRCVASRPVDEKSQNWRKCRPFRRLPFQQGARAPLGHVRRRRPSSVAPRAGQRVIAHAGQVARGGRSCREPAALLDRRGVALRRRCSSARRRDRGAARARPASAVRQVDASIAVETATRERPTIPSALRALGTRARRELRGALTSTRREAAARASADRDGRLDTCSIRTAGPASSRVRRRPGSSRLAGTGAACDRAEAGREGDATLGPSLHGHEGLRHLRDPVGLRGRDEGRLRVGCAAGTRSTSRVRFAYAADGRPVKATPFPLQTWTATVKGFRERRPPLGAHQARRLRLRHAGREGEPLARDRLVRLLSRA